MIIGRISGIRTNIWYPVLQSSRISGKSVPICCFLKTKHNRGAKKRLWSDDDQVLIDKLAVFRIRIQLNPDPAKSLNPYPDAEDPKSKSRYFLTLPFYHQKKSIERYYVVKSPIILCWFNILDLFLSP